MRMWCSHHVSTHWFEALSLMEFRLLKRKKANKKGRMHEAIISVHCLWYIIHTCSSSGCKTRQKIPLSCAVQSICGDSTNNKAWSRNRARHCNQTKLKKMYKRQRIHSWFGCFNINSMFSSGFFLFYTVQICLLHGWRTQESKGLCLQETCIAVNFVLNSLLTLSSPIHKILL